MEMLSTTVMILWLFPVENSKVVKAIIVKKCFIIILEEASSAKLWSNAEKLMIVKFKFLCTEIVKLNVSNCYCIVSTKADTRRVKVTFYLLASACIQFAQIRGRMLPFFILNSVAGSIWSISAWNLRNNWNCNPFS